MVLAFFYFLGKSDTCTIAAYIYTIVTYDTCSYYYNLFILIKVNSKKDYHTGVYIFESNACTITTGVHIFGHGTFVTFAPYPKISILQVNLIHYW